MGEGTDTATGVRGVSFRITGDDDCEEVVDRPNEKGLMGGRPKTLGSVASVANGLARGSLPIE